MTSVISPKKPDTSAQEARLAEQERQADKRARDLAQKDKSKRTARAAGGQRSLLSGTETGVKRDTMS